jgi:hypothetical protein
MKAYMNLSVEESCNTENENEEREVEEEVCKMTRIDFEHRAKCKK